LEYTQVELDVIDRKQSLGALKESSNQIIKGGYDVLGSLAEHFHNQWSYHKTSYQTNVKTILSRPGRFVKLDVTRAANHYSQFGAKT
jgi:hypothetical protein